MPSASMAEAMVLAVYMPPHAPAPGHDLRTISERSASSMAPVTNWPYDWNAETMSRGSPLPAMPGLIVPPYTMRPGRFRRPIAMMQPGMFLSQPGSEMLASYHWPPITVSMESAIRSRDCRDMDMPGVPMEMPSETPMVLKRNPTMSSAATPSFTCAARSIRCLLQGLPSHQTEEMPIWGLFMSSGSMPVA